MLLKAFLRGLLLSIKCCLVFDSFCTPFFKNSTEEKVHFFSRLNVNSPKKIKRNGILVQRPGARANILICHGFMCDKYDISFFHLVFNKYNTMTFDFRGHGEEIEGQYYTFGRDEAYDVLAAAKFLKKHPVIGDKPLIIYAFSGGAAATCVAGAINKNLCEAMILDCPFDSTDKLLERGLGKVKINLFGYEMGLPGASFFKDYAYRSYTQNILKTLLRTFANMDSKEINTMICPVYPEEAVKYIKVPAFIIGCVNDDKAPEEAVRSVYNNLASDYKQLWMDETARRHFDPIFFRLREYVREAHIFISRYLNDDLKRPYCGTNKIESHLKKDLIQKKDVIYQKSKVSNGELPLAVEAA